MNKSISPTHQTRRKMCEHCAFRKGSHEMSSNPDKLGDFIYSCASKVFFCHETMLQKNPEDSKWEGSFDQTKKPDGSPAKGADHQVCAGFALMFAEEFGFDASHIPTEDHNFFDQKKPCA